MCRMMAVLGTRATAADLASRFREEARVGRVLTSMTPGHADGWGIAYADAQGALHYAGRSTVNALADPAYDQALAALRERAPATRTIALAHVRKMTKGRLVVEHTHPFLEGGLALAHNGTVHGLAKEGESDSAAMLARIVAERRKGASVGDAIAALARDIDAHHRYSSATMLVTDGREVWGFRRVGNDPVTCAPEQCAPDYYTLGVATLANGSVVVSQEHEVLGISRDWTPVEDGAMVRVDAAGNVDISPSRA